MARVVILTGSPHYDGASQKLADNFEKGIKEAGNDVYRLMQVCKVKASHIFCN